jgi:hypothetical protein
MLSSFEGGYRLSAIGCRQEKLFGGWPKARPILTFSDSFGHFIAITATDLSQKLVAVPKIDLTLVGRTADHLDTIQGLGALERRHDAALFVFSPPCGM